RTSMHLLQVRLLGEFSAVDHRGNALSIGNKRTQALVIYLALKIGSRPTLRDIGELIAGDEARAREMVRDLQFALRFLPPGLMEGEGRQPASDEAVRLHEAIVGAVLRAPAPREAVRSVAVRPVLGLVVEDGRVAAALVEGFLSGAGDEGQRVADGAERLMGI